MLHHHPMAVPRMPLALALRDQRTMTAVLIWLAINLVFGFGLGDMFQSGEIAWEAHIGGFLVGTRYMVGAATIALLWAFVAGGLILNVFKDELPEHHNASLAAFLGDVLVGTLLSERREQRDGLETKVGEARAREAEQRAAHQRPARLRPQLPREALGKGFADAVGTAGAALAAAAATAAAALGSLSP